MAVLVFESVDISTLPSLSNASHNQNLDDRDRVFVIEMVARDALTRSRSLTVEADRLLQTRWIESGNTISSLYPVQHHSSIELICAFATLCLTLAHPPLGLHGCILTRRSRNPLRTHSDNVPPCNSKFTRSLFPSQRFVDGGYFDRTGGQVITSGGISSGLDATFYMIYRNSKGP